MFSSSRNRPLRVWAILFGALIIAFSPCLATKSVARPEVGLDIDATVFVSDNPFLLPGENRGSGAIEMAARPYVDWYLDPRTKLEFNGELGFRQYTRLYSNFVIGFADLELRHRRNEYLTVSAEATYSRELISESLTDSIDSAFDSRGISEIVDARTTVTWTPSATLTITGDGGWRNLHYPHSALLQTTDAYDAGVTASKRLSARTSVGVQARVTSSHPADDRNTSVRSVNLIAAHRFSETLRGNALVGAEWSKVNYSIDQGDRARFNGAITLCYEPQHTTLCINGAIGSVVSGLGGLQRETSFGGTLRNRISERGTFTAEIETRKTDVPGDEAQARVLRAEARYEHRLNRTLYLTTGASYLQREVGRAEADAVIFQIGLSIRGERR